MTTRRSPPTFPPDTLNEAQRFESAQESQLIDGQWVGADSGAVREVRNPADGEVRGHGAGCGTAETRRAIEAAQRALPGLACADGRGARAACCGAGSI